MEYYAKPTDKKPKGAIAKPRESLKRKASSSDMDTAVEAPKGSVGLTALCYAHAKVMRLGGDAANWEIPKQDVRALCSSLIPSTFPFDLPFAFPSSRWAVCPP